MKWQLGSYGVVLGALLVLPCVLSCGASETEAPSAREVATAPPETATRSALPAPTPTPQPTVEPIVSQVIEPPTLQCGVGFMARAKPRFTWLRWTPDGSGLMFDDQFLIRMADARGTRLETLVNPAGRFDHMDYSMYADISPDGQRIAFGSCQYSLGTPRPDQSGRVDKYAIALTYNYEIATMDAAGGNERRLTEHEEADNQPTWSPDGRRIAFVRYGRGRNFTSDRIYSVRTDGSDPQLIAAAGGYFRMPYYFRSLSWSPTGEHISVVLYEDPHGKYVKYPVVYTVSAEGGGDLQRVSETSGPPSWSPDGERLALIRYVPGGAVLITARPDGSDVRSITEVTGYGLDRPWWRADSEYRAIPVWWSPSGDHIAYRCETICIVDLEGNEVGRVPRQFTDIISLRALRELLWSGNATEQLMTEFDVGSVHGHSFRGGQMTMAWSPDGTRIAVLTPEVGQHYKKPVIYTMDPDATDPFIVVRGDETLVAANPGWPGVASALAVCRSEEVVDSELSGQALVRDCETLVKLHDTLGGGRTFLNWGTRQLLNQWQGVQIWVNPSRVSGLLLESCKREDRASLPGGVIPEALVELDALEKLDLRCNRLKGPIPPQLGELSNLQELDLRHNDLSGAIPEQLGKLEHLKRLDLRGNEDLSCEVPIQILEHHNAEMFKFPCDP